MGKFRFELEPLLRARRMTEQSHQRVVAAIESERMKLESALRDLQQQISHEKFVLQGDLVGRIDAHQLRLTAAATMQSMRKAQRFVLELAGVHRRLETARAQLIETTKQRRAVELLRERRFEEWKQRQDKMETDAIDELAVIAAARQRLSAHGAEK
jgi:flagellar protein FliJ